MAARFLIYFFGYLALVWIGISVVQSLTLQQPLLDCLRSHRVSTYEVQP